MKNVITIAALIAITTLTGCKDNTQAQPAPFKVSKFECIPDTRSDFLNNRLVRETSVTVNGENTKLTITGGDMNMRLSVFDPHLPATREFTNFRVFGEDRIMYNTTFTADGKNYTQKFILDINSYEKNKFFYQRATETFDDDNTPIAVSLAGYCYRIGTAV